MFGVSPCLTQTNTSPWTYPDMSTKPRIQLLQVIIQVVRPAFFFFLGPQRGFLKSVHNAIPEQPFVLVPNGLVMTYVLPQASPLFGDQLILQFLFHHPRNDANAAWIFKKPIRLISDSCKDSRDLYRWIYLLVQIERRGGSTLEIPSSSATRLLILADNRRLEESLKN